MTSEFYNWLTNKHYEMHKEINYSTKMVSYNFFPKLHYVKDIQK